MTLLLSFGLACQLEWVLLHFLDYLILVNISYKTKLVILTVLKNSNRMWQNEISDFDFKVHAHSQNACRVEISNTLYKRMSETLKI